MFTQLKLRVNESRAGDNGYALFGEHVSQRPARATLICSAGDKLSPASRVELAARSAESLAAFLAASEPGLETAEECPRCQNLDAKGLLQLEQVRVAGDNELRSRS